MRIEEHSVDKRQLGTTDLQVTPVGFGAWAIGGPDYAFGWGAQDDDESVAAIERAVDAGINWIDTAPVYGLGRSERSSRGRSRRWGGRAGRMCSRSARSCGTGRVRFRTP